MGKFRSKLKGQTKGKRWPKGQSSSSNPATKKYRDLAKSRFFQENLGPSNLTSDALLKHDSLTTYLPPKLPTSQPSLPSEMDTDSETSTYNTVQTFASDWSNCSNASFSRLMHVFKPDSALHKEMLSILAAVTEVIKKKGGDETSTEYYAALMTTLRVTENELTLAAVLTLLNMGIKSVPNSVLRMQFGTASKMFLDLLEKNCNSESTHILKSLLGLLGALLRGQEKMVWTYMSTLQMLGSILAFSCHTKPKVRKAAHSAICSILKASCFMIEQYPPAHHPAAAHVANFCIQQIEASTASSGQTTLLHTLSLLKDIIHVFPKQQMKSTCECILKIMTLNNALVNANGLQVLHSLFSAPRSTMPAQLNGQLITALYDYQPSATDVQATCAWLTTLTSAHVHLSDTHHISGLAALPRAFETISQLWLTERPQLMSAVTHSLQTLLEDCFDKYGEAVEKVYNVLKTCLGYQFNKAWHLVLHVLAIAFKCAPNEKMVTPILQHLAELRDSYKFSYNNELEYAVGAAVKSLGPKLVLEVISLKKLNGEINLDRSWLLPVLKENIQFSTLEYFVKTILPVALLCEKQSKILAQTNDGIGSHSYELLYIQLWSLLPSFCKFPTDITENFKNVAKVLGTAISDKKELRLFVMSSLRKLIHNAKENDNEKEKIEIGRFAKNYLPILFNLYTTKPNGSDEEGQRLASLDTIKEYLTITPLDLTEQLFKNALITLKSDQQDTFIKESILDLIRCLAPYQKLENLQLLYDECIKNFLEIKNKKEQKKAYRLLETILTNQNETCVQFLKVNRKQIQKLLTKSLNSAAVSSRASRLRCQHYLVRAQPQLRHDAKLFRTILPEAVLCCKDINEKCRQAAENVIVGVGEVLERHGEMTQFAGMMMGGLAGTPEMVQSSVLALAIVTHNFTSALGQENTKLILETVTQLMASANREIVASCLVYLKIYIGSVPSPLVAQNLREIVKSLTSMSEDCQRHFRLRVRDILNKLTRKFGSDSISCHIPPSDVIMFKRLRNIRKMQERKKRQKENFKNDDSSDDDEFKIRAKPQSMEEILADSDSDFEDVDEQKEERRKAPKSWIQEDENDFVDFTDPSAARKITATKPGENLVLEKPKKKNHGFKVSTDGRLIIQDESDNSDTEDTKKIPNSDSDSEDDFKSAAETAILGSSKKRKRDTDSVFSAPAMKYKAGGSGIHRPLPGSSGSSKSPGGEYKSKKSSGDVKRKGKVDPYAYLPMSRQLLNKRKRLKSSSQFKGIVKAANKGARKGAKSGRVTKRK